MITAALLYLCTMTSAAEAATVQNNYFIYNQHYAREAPRAERAPRRHPQPKQTTTRAECMDDQVNIYGHSVTRAAAICNQPNRDCIDDQINIYDNPLKKAQAICR